MNYKPFNLEKALAGNPVVTRSGKEVIALHYFNCLPAGIPCIVAVINEEHRCIESYFADGSFSPDCKESEYDLFMAPKSVEYWVATGKDNSPVRKNAMYSFGPVQTEGLVREEAMRYPFIDHSTIQTHKITRYE